MVFRLVARSALRQGRPITLLAAGAFAVASFGLPALAQTEGEQAAGAGGELGNWVKICVREPSLDDKEVCLTTQEARAETGEFVAAVTVGQLVEDDQKIIRAMVPIGAILPPGFAVQIDESEPRPGQFSQCLPQACYGEMEIDASVVDAMKRGSNLVLYWIDHEAQQRGLGFTLMGFTKAFDGPPIDTELLAQQRQRLQEELQRRAADARERLMQQQGAGEGAPSTE